MTALVVVDVSRSSGALDGSARLDIFPGGAVPSVYPAERPFWIGYGFAPDADAAGSARSLEDGTRFELSLDGRDVELRSDLVRHGDAIVRKTEIASFAAGLPVGWHSFRGSWYDGGKLLFSSRVSVEFVEP